MYFDEFKNEIIASYKDFFPHSLCTCSIFKRLGMKSISIRCFLAGDKDEFPYGIPGNDTFRISFGIDLPSDFDLETDELPNTMTIVSESKTYRIAPPNEYFACGSKRIPFRKATGSPEKLISVFSETIRKTHIQFQDDFLLGNTHKDDFDLITSKLIGV